MFRRYAVAQLGARMHYAVPYLLYQAGMLEHFYTDICAVKGWPRLLHLIPGFLRPASIRRLLGRVPHRVPAECITAFTNFGLEYASRLANSDSQKTTVYLWAGKTFCELVIRHGLGSASGVYTFNGAGLELLRAARARGLQTVMEQTIAPREIEDQLLHQEHLSFPGWERRLHDDDVSKEFYAREHDEWNEADMILCASEFVRDGIAAVGGPVPRCAVVPYGVDTRFFVPERSSHTGPLRVLSIGAIGLRKGSPYVLEAAKRLKGRAVFRMVGSVPILPQAEDELRAHVEVTGPIPRADILRQYTWADVFLLPSLCEGSATVIYEALAAGLPVICTPNSGSVVWDGVDGFVVPPSDTDAIVEKLEFFAANEQDRKEMSVYAAERAKEFSLTAYGKRLVAALTANAAATGAEVRNPC